jgi:Tol biopolymer transport system component/DNA-binding SARP family transcriptional activator
MFGALTLDPEHPSLGQRKRLALLALLAHAGRAGVSRDKITSYLWPESDSDHARNALSQLVYGIRRELGEASILSVGPDVRIAADLLPSDVAEFRDALDVGDFERAVSAYAGPFLDGVHLRDAPEFERWSDEARRELEARYHDALDRLAQHATARADAAAVVRWTRARSVSEPVSTRAALAHVRALVAAGDRGAALQYAQLHASLIRTQLDAEPDAEFEQYVATLRAAPSARVSPSSGTTTIVDVLPVDANRDPHVVSLRTRGAGRPAKRTLMSGAAAILIVATALGFASEWNTPIAYSTGATTPLTSGQAVELEPAISPDGKFVAFVAGRPGEMATALAPMRIFVKQVAGGRAVPLSSDSTSVERSPRWSPDGTRIAFQTGRGIFVAPAFGGTPEQLVADSGQGLLMGSWSPDGTRIAFADDGGVWTRDVSRGTQHHVTTAGFRPHSVTWSPDGNTLAFVVGTGGAYNIAPSSIWLVPSAGGHAERVSDVEHLNTSPVFTPDGRSLLFVSSRDGMRDVYQQALRRSGQPQGDPTRLTTGSNAISISLSTDGKQLAYGALTMRSNIWSAPIFPGKTTPASAAEPITSGNQEIECLSISPDGKWLIYDSNKSGNQDIYKMPVAGGDAIQLTTDPADDFCGVMSSDSREIVFYTFRDGGRRRVYTMLADGGAQAPASDTIGQQRSPTWAPDGTQIAFYSNRSGRNELYVETRLPAGGWSAPRRIDGGSGGTGVRWSPDGKYFAVSRDSGLLLVSATNTAPPFWAVRTSRDRGSSFGNDGPAMAWGADPSIVYYRMANPRPPTEFWSISVAGGPPHLALRFGDSTHVIRRGGFATNGKRIYFTVAGDEASAFLVELKR